MTSFDIALVEPKLYLEGVGRMSYVAQYLKEATEILRRLDHSTVERTTDLLLELRERSGRLFILGVGGGAGHASHAVCDFRKIAQIEAYAPSDNVSELTARVNDDGWETCYANWLRGCRVNEADMVFVFSVGGGDARENISANLVRALEYAQEVRATICGVVGRDGGYMSRPRPLAEDSASCPHPRHSALPLGAQSHLRF